MKNSFSIPFEGTRLIGDIMAAGQEKPSVIFLHGAGDSSRARWEFFREALLGRGIGSCAFDFIGQGETGGDITSSSLERRTRQALAVIAALGFSHPLTIIGSSMGAYTGLKISERVAVSMLIFFVPAVYDTAAYQVPFGPSFSGRIREPESWKKTDAWDIIAKFTGKVFIIAAENDEVVPRELTQRLYDAARHATMRELKIINGASHMVGKLIKENAEMRDAIVSLITNFMEH